MKIVEKNPTRKVAFRDIPAGSLFKTMSGIYIALSDDEEICFTDISETENTVETEHFGVSLETGEAVCFSYDEMVTPIDGTLTYERI